MVKVDGREALVTDIAQPALAQAAIVAQPRIDSEEDGHAAGGRRAEPGERGELLPGRELACPGQLVLGEAAGRRRSQIRRGGGPGAAPGPRRGRSYLRSVPRATARRAVTRRRVSGDVANEERTITAARSGLHGIGGRFRRRVSGDVTNEAPPVDRRADAPRHRDERRG